MPTGFTSVKLSSALVDEARFAAQPLRRSVASQIEYWATLGCMIEHSGLTMQEAQNTISAYEGTAPSEQERTVMDLSQRIGAANVDGTLTANLKWVIESNRSGNA